MKRFLNINTAFSQVFDNFQFEGVYDLVLGTPTKHGSWIVYGKEKNGKTWLALKLADMLSDYTKVWYVSGEEGLDSDFVGNMKRARLQPDNRQLFFSPYTSLNAITARLQKRNPPKVVVIDNVTVYASELSYGGYMKLVDDNPNTLFIFVAHEEKNEPYTATAKMIKRLSKLIFRVEGLACHVSGRCPGGNLMIDEQRAVLFHGEKIKENNSKKAAK